MIKANGSNKDSSVDLSQLEEEEAAANAKDRNNLEGAVHHGEAFGYDTRMNRRILVGVLLVNAIGNL